MSKAVETDSADVRFPPPFVYLGVLLLGLAAERFVTLRSFGIDWRLLVAIQTQVIAREERYLEAKFGDDYRRYKAEVRRWL